MASGTLIFASLLGFLGGVFLASLGVGALWITALSFLLFLSRRYLPTVPLKAIFFGLGALFFGIIYFHAHAVFEERSLRLPDEHIIFQAVIKSEAEIRGKAAHFEIALQAPFYGRVLMTAEPQVDWIYGARLRLRGEIENMSWPDPPRLYYPEIVSKEEPIFSFSGFLFSLKHRAEAVFEAALPQNEAALLSGLTLGARSDFSPEIKEAMKKSGTTHLVALSGYNILILIFGVRQLLGSFLSRRQLFYLLSIVIPAFVLMVGAEASIARAGLMGWLLLLAEESGRLTKTSYLIALAATLMVLWDPTVLVFDLGFQLSFLSLLGIIYLQPVLAKWWGRESSFFDSGWSAALLTTFSAQAAVYPLLTFYFGEASLTALFSNILILWLVPTTMFGGFLLVLLGSISAGLGFFLGQAVQLLLSYELWVIDLFSRLVIPLPSFQSVWFLILYYGGLLYLLLRHYRRYETRPLL